MKFVAIIDGKKKGADRITSFIYPDDGPVPPIVNPEKPEEEKDGGAPEPPTPADKSQSRVQRLVPGRTCENGEEDRGIVANLGKA